MNRHKNLLATGALLAISLLVCPALAAEKGKVTSRSTFLSVTSVIDGKPRGFCGLVFLEVDRLPAACFGLHQSPGQKARFTYLVLFKPDPKSERGSGTEGEGPSTISSDGEVKADLKMAVHAGGRRIEIQYKLDATAEKIIAESLKVGGVDSGKGGPRVFLVDLADEKTKVTAVKAMPPPAPDLGDDEAWGPAVLAAIKELKEKSPEVKAFFGEQK